MSIPQQSPAGALVLGVLPVAGGTDCTLDSYGLGPRLRREARRLGVNSS